MGSHSATAEFIYLSLTNAVIVALGSPSKLAGVRVCLCWWKVAHLGVLSSAWTDSMGAAMHWMYGVAPIYCLLFMALLG